MASEVDVEAFVVEMRRKRDVGLLSTSTVDKVEAVVARLRAADREVARLRGALVDEYRVDEARERVYCVGCAYVGKVGGQVMRAVKFEDIVHVDGCALRGTP
jgi:hypothetical protein